MDGKRASSSAAAAVNAFFCCLPLRHASSVLPRESWSGAERAGRVEAWRYRQEERASPERAGERRAKQTATSTGYSTVAVRSCPWAQARRVVRRPSVYLSGTMGQCTWFFQNQNQKNHSTIQSFNHPASSNLQISKSANLNPQSQISAPLQLARRTNQRAAINQ